MGWPECFYDLVPPQVQRTLVTLQSVGLTPLYVRPENDLVNNRKAVEISYLFPGLNTFLEKLMPSYLSEVSEV